MARKKKTTTCKATESIKVETTENNIVKADALKSLFALDSGQAVIAAVIVAVIGFLASVFLRVYNMVYWKSYFELFRIPDVFYYTASIKLKDVDVFLSIVVSVLYATILYRATKSTTKKSQFYIMIFAVLLSAGMVSVVICIITNGYTLIFNTIFMQIATLITGVYAFYRNKLFVLDEDSSKKPISKNGIIAALSTFIIVSLAITFCLGCLYTCLHFEYKQIHVDGETTEKTYVKMLDLQDGYLCMPAKYGPILETGSDESILTIDTNEYRVIPKDACVTVSAKPIIAFGIEPRSSYMDFINNHEYAFVLIIGALILVGIIVIRLELKYM